MSAFINKYNSDNEYYFDEGCFINEGLNDEVDSQVSIARARVEPGVSTEWHKLIDVTERYLIIAGTGLVEVQGVEPTEVAAGDVVYIPAECAQRITNTGSCDLLFYAICSPRFTRSCYIALENHNDQTDLR